MDNIDDVLDQIHTHIAKTDNIDPSLQKDFHELDKSIRAMNEVKKPKKPLIYYYAIVLLVLLLFNFLAMVRFYRITARNYLSFYTCEMETDKTRLFCFFTRY